MNKDLFIFIMITQVNRNLVHFLSTLVNNLMESYNNILIKDRKKLLVYNKNIQQVK